MPTTPHGRRFWLGTDPADLQVYLQQQAEDGDSLDVAELTTAQRDLLPAAARWPGRTVWERLASGARRLVAWDQGAQQWREELASRSAAVRTVAAGAADGNGVAHNSGDRTLNATLTVPGDWGSYSVHVASSARLFASAGALRYGLDGRLDGAYLYSGSQPHEQSVNASSASTATRSVAGVWVWPSLTGTGQRVVAATLAVVAGGAGSTGVTDNWSVSAIAVRNDPL